MNEWSAIAAYLASAVSAARAAAVQQQRPVIVAATHKVAAVAVAAVATFLELVTLADAACGDIVDFIAD